MQLLEYWTHDTNYILCIILIHINITMPQAGLIHRRRVMLLMRQALYPQTTMAGYRTSINILSTIAFALHVFFLQNVHLKTFSARSRQRGTPKTLNGDTNYGVRMKRPYEASTILHVRPEVRSASTFRTTATKLGRFMTWVSLVS